ncbi:MAG TPA: hypothetical protein VMV56_07590 [Williamwhitmania sp.]|nr:hypothetical protein [Williamwhitmania sp.]
MAVIFTDGSTEVKAANLNKFVAGGGTILGLHLFSMVLELYNDTGTMKYKLYVNSVTADYTALSDLGATEEAAYTAFDSNVSRNGAGDYEINVDAVTHIFCVGSAYGDDTNITQFDVLGDITSHLIVINTKTNAGANAELASGKKAYFRIIGFFS